MAADEKDWRGLTSVIESSLAPWGVPGIAIAVTSGEGIAILHGAGLRDVGRGLPVTTRTIFPIASCSKAMAAVVVGALVDEGRLAWDEPMRTYLPDFALSVPGAADGLTLVDLLSHQSGLPTHHGLWFNNQGASRDDLIARIPFLETTAPPRERWQYSNLMYSVVAKIAEVASGEDWDGLMRTRVFEPLGMTDSVLSIDAARASANSARPHESVDGVVVEMPDRGIGAYAAAGGVFASAEGLANWMIMNLNRGRFAGRVVIRPDTLATIHAPRFPWFGVPGDEAWSGYALGWTTGRVGGRLVVSHDGGASGSSASVCLLPEEGYGVALLANAQGCSELLQQLTAHATDLLLGEVPRDWVGEALERRQASAVEEAPRERIPAPAADERRIADYAGDYSERAYGRVLIEVDGGALVAVHNTEGTSPAEWHREPLAPQADADAFVADGGRHPLLARGTSYRFDRDDTGAVSALSIAFDPAIRPIRFDRRLFERRLAD